MRRHSKMTALILPSAPNAYTLDFTLSFIHDASLPGIRHLDLNDEDH